MTKLVEDLVFTRALAALLIGNISCLVVCNLLQAAAWVVIPVYPACVAAGWLLVRRARLRSPRVVATRAMIAAVWVVALGLAGVRFYYVMEWIPGNTVHVLWDDHARIAELVSLTLSDGYPLASPVSQSYLFSFYYAPLYPMAFLKLVVPVLTLKDAIFVGCLLYNVLILFALLEIATLVVGSARAVWIFLYFVLAYSGLDWVANVLANGEPFIGHHEWWQRGEPFHAMAQITAFPTALFFTVHHVVAAMSCLFAWVFWWRARFCEKRLKLLVVGLLLVNAFYSSVFVVLGCLPMLAVDARRLARRYCRSVVLPLLVAAWTVPLYLFCGKLPGQGFGLATARLGLSEAVWLDKLLSFPFWLAALVVVELAAVPLLLGVSWRRLQVKERAYLAGAVAFFISTYLVAYSANNNYSMRGMLVPSLVFALLAARHSQRILSAVRTRRLAVTLLVVVAIGFAFGNVFEFAGHARRAAMSMSMTLRYTRGQQGARQKFPYNYRDIARDHKVEVYEPHPGEAARQYFNAEKRVERRLEDLDRWERELLRHPRRGWFR